MTNIEWTDETWNPVTGCTKVSQGCKNCYAERLAPKVFAGQTVLVDTTPPKHPEMKASAFRPRHFTDVLTHPERLEAPLHWKKPRRIFVNSMSDLFHEDVPDEFLADVFATMAYARQHQFQVLTKRPQRMLRLLTSVDWLDMYEGWTHLVHDQACDILGRRGEFDPNARRTDDIRAFDPSLPLRNVWLGVSIEDQATADERIPLLLQTPAAVRFLSCEPLLGPIELRRAFGTEGQRQTYVEQIDWVIAGGESGPKARPSHPDWFRSLRDQCAAAGVAFFFKQWGEFAPDCFCNVMAERACKDTPRPEPGHIGAMFRCGKKAAGRTLDGRTHDEYPA